MGAHPWLGETLCETGARDSVSDPLSSLENAILWVHILGTIMGIRPTLSRYTVGQGCTIHEISKRAARLHVLS